MASRRRGKPSNNELPVGLARYALNLIRERYTDFGSTLVTMSISRKKLSGRLWLKPVSGFPANNEHQNFSNRAIDVPVVVSGSRLMVVAITSLRTERPAITALVYVDDATSWLTTFTYFDATRGYLEKHGKPTGKTSVFTINRWRWLYPIECAHLTLRDHLVKELRYRKYINRGLALYRWAKRAPASRTTLPYSTYCTSPRLVRLLYLTPKTIILSPTRKDTIVRHW
ncbi:Uncharacterised protein [Raoultella planticola]|nr:Uncharacterised protein [Raoultella planticola]